MNMLSAALPKCNGQTLIKAVRQKIHELQDVYYRAKLAGLSGTLLDGTTWNLTMATKESFGFNKKDVHRYLCLKFSNPVAHGTLINARYAPRYVDNIEYHYLHAKALGVDVLKRRGFELADPDDEGAFCVRYARKTSTGVCRPA
ncbi:MAG: hypothetical protein DESF_01494 [Desulfovibrio sp.]